MEYDGKMYQVAKNMQMIAQQTEKERKNYKTLWEDGMPKTRRKPMPLKPPIMRSIRETFQISHFLMEQRTQKMMQMDRNLAHI